MDKTRRRQKAHIQTNLFLHIILTHILFYPPLDIFPFASLVDDELARTLDFYQSSARASILEHSIPQLIIQMVYRIINSSKGGGIFESHMPDGKVGYGILFKNCRISAMRYISVQIDYGRNKFAIESTRPAHHIQSQAKEV